MLYCCFVQLTFPYGNWHFYDLETQNGQIAVYVSQWVTCVSNLYFMSCFDSFIVTFMELVCGDLQILHYQLKNLHLGKSPEIFLLIFYFSLSLLFKDQNGPKHTFTGIVRHHQSILKYVYLLLLHY